MKFKSFKTVKMCLMIQINFLAQKMFALKFIMQPIYQFAHHFYEKKEGSGSVRVTNRSGCGSGRPKNIWIRIRNTLSYWSDLSFSLCKILLAGVRETGSGPGVKPQLSCSENLQNICISVQYKRPHICFVHAITM